LSTLDLSKLAATVAAQNPPPVMESVEQAVPQKRVFKSALKSMQMITTKGFRILFVNHRYFTDNPDVIKYLDDEIKAGCKDVMVDKEEYWYNPEIHDPVARLRAQMRREIMQEMLAVSGNPNRNMGESTAGKLNPANTATIASVAAGAGPSGMPVLSIPK
jgi:hypothetical protein